MSQNLVLFFSMAMIVLACCVLTALLEKYISKFFWVGLSVVIGLSILLFHKAVEAFSNGNLPETKITALFYFLLCCGIALSVRVLLTIIRASK